MPTGKSGKKSVLVTIPVSILVLLDDAYRLLLNFPLVGDHLSVSILVLLDDAYRHGILGRLRYSFPIVSILVLLDDAYRQLIPPWKVCLVKVSILVLLDDAYRLSFQAYYDSVSGTFQSLFFWRMPTGKV